MSNALIGLNQIPGVIGSAIFNAQDECVVHMLPAPYDPDLLAKVMAELRNALNVLMFLDENATWSAIVTRYESGYLVVRNIQGLTIVVLAQPSLNPAMLSVGFNVAALKLEKEGVPPPLHVPLPLPLPPPPAASPTPQPPPPPPLTMTMPLPAARQPTLTSLPAMKTPPPAPQLTPVSSSQNVSISQSGSQSGSQTTGPQHVAHTPPTPAPQAHVGVSGRTTGPMAVTPVSHSSPHVAQSATGQVYRDSMSMDSGLAPRVPAAVGAQVMEGLLKALARHIGPFAKLILKEELHKLGATAATLGFSQYLRSDNLGNLLRPPTRTNA